MFSDNCRVIWRPISESFWTARTHLFEGWTAFRSRLQQIDEKYNNSFWTETIGNVEGRIVQNSIYVGRWTCLKSISRFVLQVQMVSAMETIWTHCYPTWPSPACNTNDNNMGNSTGDASECSVNQGLYLI